MDYVISDLHFDHTNILKYEKRPFTNAKEMNEVIVKNWNAVVKPTDRVFILGDVMFTHNKSEVINMLNRLNGRLVIVLGNHDKPLTNLYNSGSFRDIKQKIYIVQSMYEPKVTIDINSKKQEKVFLSHYPVFEWNAKFHGRKHFYGHVHTGENWDAYRKLNIPNTYNVGVELLDYTPRTFQEAIDINDNIK